jgi:hypothetical protein
MMRITNRKIRKVQINIHLERIGINMRNDYRPHVIRREIDVPSIPGQDS